VDGHGAIGAHGDRSQFGASTQRGHLCVSFSINRIRFSPYVLTKTRTDDDVLHLTAGSQLTNFFLIRSLN
jgi:hypothetical protein